MSTITNDGFTVIRGKHQSKKSRNKKNNAINNATEQFVDQNKEIKPSIQCIEYVSTHNDENISQRPNIDSRKKILCYNTLMCGSCMYGNKCVFAHNLDEQNIDIIRKKAYDLLKGNNALNEIDLLNDDELYHGLLQLTRVCFGCENKTCLGGYNCKNGAISSKYVVCYSDLNFGKCTNTDCKKIHLTTRGLINHRMQEILHNNLQNNKNASTLINIQQIPKTEPLSISNSEKEIINVVKNTSKEHFEKIKEVPILIKEDIKELNKEIGKEISRKKQLNDIMIQQHQDIHDDLNSIDSLSNDSSDDEECNEIILTLMP